MSAALRATGSRRQRSQTPDPAAGTPQVTPVNRTLTAVPPRTASQTVKVLPAPATLPLWLRALLGVQRASSVLTLLLVVACLSVYGWTVCSQQMMRQQSRKLETLRRQEGQLAVANETLKNQLAKQAEHPGSGLVSPTPDRMIFLNPAPPRHRAAPADQSGPAGNSQKAASKPLGY
ncbi:hypothetical protein [Kamptonema formosum]|uniref:hypothetical protein n=1 Tax=Kamptonema formosum TaxID=331992 RepID=UPI000346CEB0|nr:hypothetical protein [Oscillatoria sp. PCC 10802]